MQNYECRMQNVELRNQRSEVGGWRVRFWRFSTRHASFGILRPSFCILHSAFYISSRSGQALKYALRLTSGQALIESCLVIALICLILAGFFQLAQIYSAKEIISYACARGARAKTVGFNDFMVKKTVRVATIPNAGKMTFPEAQGGPLGQMAIEHGRIPLYLSAEWYMLDGILQYEDWETINCNYTDDNSLLFQFFVSQDLPLRYFPAFFRAFYRADSIPIGTELRLDNHALLYLE